MNLEQLTKPLNVNGSPSNAVITRLNEIFTGSWSFRIINHEIHDTETIVLGELTAEGIVKQQFGRTKITINSETSEMMSIGDDLKKAALNALVNCAHEFGIPFINHTGEKQKSQSQESNQQDNGNGTRPLTNRQLAAIFGLGKSHNLGQNEVINLTKNRFGKEPMGLTLEEASELISEFKNDNGKEDVS